MLAHVYSPCSTLQSFFESHLIHHDMASEGEAKWLETCRPNVAKVNIYTV